MTELDIVSVAQIHVNAWRNAYRGLLPDDQIDNLSLEKRISRWTELQKDKNIAKWVCEDNGQVVGFCSCVATSQGIEIKTLYVAHELWRKGFGTELITTIRREHLGQRFYLWTLKSNDPTVNFYKKQGFAATGQMKIDNSCSGFSIVDIEMALNAEM